jgi:hypothetical protein
MKPIKNKSQNCIHYRIFPLGIYPTGSASSLGGCTSPGGAVEHKFICNYIKGVRMAPIGNNDIRPHCPYDDGDPDRLCLSRTLREECI